MAEAKKKEESAKSAPAPKAPKEVTSEKHSKKVGKMNYSELEAAIAACEKSMGGLWSHYGLSLKAHRDAMASHAPMQHRKAA